VITIFDIHAFQSLLDQATPIPDRPMASGFFQQAGQSRRIQIFVDPRSGLFLVFQEANLPAWFPS
jgi:hypothetical protein